MATRPLRLSAELHEQSAVLAITRRSGWPNPETARRRARQLTAIDRVGFTAIASSEDPHLRREFRGHVYDGFTIVGQAMREVAAARGSIPPGTWIESWPGPGPDTGLTKPMSGICPLRVAPRRLGASIKFVGPKSRLIHLGDPSNPQTGVRADCALIDDASGPRSIGASAIRRDRRACLPL